MLEHGGAVICHMLIEMDGLPLGPAEWAVAALSESKHQMDHSRVWPATSHPDAMPCCMADTAKTP